MQLHPFAPKSEYQQNDSKISCLISLESSLTVSGEFISARGIARQIEESLNCQYKRYRDMVLFDDSIIKYLMNNSGEKHLHYYINKW